MIPRAHGLVLSLLLGAATAAGFFAIVVTAHLGDAQTKPEVVSSRAIAKRAHKLDDWQASLKKALKVRPPALPPLNRYAAVTYVSAPGAASLPTPAAPSGRTVLEVKQPSEPVAKAKTASRVKAKSRPVVAKAARHDDEAANTAPVAATEPQHETPERETPAPAPVAVASAPAAAPAPRPQPAQPPAPLSVEQQCRALMRAAEGKSEQVKQDAERQCEALKQAAEEKG